MTIDEIMARLTPQEQQHTSPENVAAVLRVLAASIADTAGAKPEAFYDARSKEPCLMWAFDGYEPGPHDVVLYAAPPAPSVADVPAMTNEQINHKPGCDALGGYGHGVGPCTCKDAAGASEDARDAERYRKVRQHAYRYGVSNPTAEQLDAALDTAIAADAARDGV